MQGKSTYIGFSLLTCCVALSLASCQNSSWHLAASKKGGTVELCLSNGDTCPQAGGVSPSSISVYRWDNMHDNELVWDAEPKNPITTDKRHRPLAETSLGFRQHAPREMLAVVRVATDLISNGSSASCQ